MLRRIRDQTRNRLLAGTGLGIAGALVLLRQPHLILHPRFWAEEGTIYFSGAACLPWSEFLQQPVARGYYRLFSNVSALLAAHLVPLEQAPLVTTLLAFLVQMIPLAIVLFGTSRLYTSWPSRLLMAGLILLSIYSGEVWLHTVGQVWLLLSAVLILAEEMQGVSALRRWCYRAVLVLAGLSVPGTAVIAPLFLVRAWVHRAREHTVHAVLSAATAAFQIVFFAATLDQANVDERFAGGGWLALPYALWSRIVLAPLGGVQLGDWFASLSREVLNRGIVLALPIGLALVALFVLVCWWLVRLRQADVTRVLVAVAALLILGFTLATAGTHGDKSNLLSPQWSPRYTYVPSVLFLALVLSNVGLEPRRLHGLRSGLCAALLLLALVVGAVNWGPSLRPFFSRDWPAWRQEVALYRHDPAYRELRIWPPGWTSAICEP